MAGYEDCNDADTLRSDPMLKTVCDQLPESDPDLATQPTFSRLENSVTKKDLMRLSRWLLGRYVRSLKKRRPSKIILDLDSTDDHTHGQQEFSFYHGYYRNHILHPLLIFDADTGDLVCAVLRPGNKGAASHIVPILKRVVEAIRQAVGTDVEIEIRADSGFATPRLYEFCECEENKLQYVIGLSRNPRLQRVVEPLLDSTRERFLEREEKQRQFDEFLYRAHSWDRSRRVIVKVEVDQRGINRRFVVTNRLHHSARRQSRRHIQQQMHMIGSHMPLHDLDIQRSANLSRQIPHLFPDLSSQSRLAVLGDEHKVISQPIHCMRTFPILRHLRSAPPSLLKASPKGEGVHPSQSGTLSRSESCARRCRPWECSTVPRPPDFPLLER